MKTIHKIEKLVKSCRLLDDKIKKARYWTMNGNLHPEIKKQILSIIKQAKNIEQDQL